MSRADEATTTFAETGVAAGRGSINTYSVGGGVTQDLGRMDTVSLTANASEGLIYRSHSNAEQRFNRRANLESRSQQHDQSSQFREFRLVRR